MLPVDAPGRGRMVTTLLAALFANLRQCNNDISDAATAVLAAATRILACLLSPAICIWHLLVGAYNTLDLGKHLVAGPTLSSGAKLLCTAKALKNRKYMEETVCDSGLPQRQTRKTKINPCQPKSAKLEIQAKISDYELSYHRWAAARPTLEGIDHIMRPSTTL